MYIHSEEVSDITYVVDRVRVKVKAIGALTAADVHAVHRYESTKAPSDPAPTDTGSADLSKVCTGLVWLNVCV